jgi:bifunctional DNA-binding transcriptional regulator/antitoxin component of YhaV-PrlF toxin-antitoxin module
MNPPHGPLKIGANRQITLPADLMRQVSLEPGDSVYVAVDHDASGCLQVIPVELLVTWLESGRRSTRVSDADRDPSPGLDTPS